MREYHVYKKTARSIPFMRANSPANCDVQPTESNFKTCQKIILMCIAVLLFLTGCGQKEVPVYHQDEDGILLTVLAGQSTSDAGIEDMIDEVIAEEYPNVKLQWECVDWGEKFNSQMQGRFAAGDIPDIMIGKAQDVQAYAHTGNLSVLPKDYTDRIRAEALKAVTVDGAVYGMPYNAWYQGVIYNKEIFRKYNLKVPETQKGLSDIIKVLKENGVTPFASHFRESWKVGNMTMQFFMNEIFSSTPEWGDRFRQGGVNFTDSPVIRRCLSYNKMILDASWQDALLIDQFESDSRFTQGQAAMYLTGSWSMQFTSQYNENMELGIFPFPNENGNARLIRETNMTFMKSSKTKHSELINDIFNTLLTSEKLEREILDFTQTASVVKGVEPASRSRIQDDIDRYEKDGQVVEVSLGNSQFVWSFQNDLAAQQLLWLQGEKTLDEVLAYADREREESAY